MRWVGQRRPIRAVWATLMVATIALLFQVSAGSGAAAMEPKEGARILLVGQQSDGGGSSVTLETPAGTLTLLRYELSESRYPSGVCRGCPADLTSAPAGTRYLYVWLRAPEIKEGFSTYASLHDLAASDVQVGLPDGRTTPTSFNNHFLDDYYYQFEVPAEHEEFVLFYVGNPPIGVGPSGIARIDGPLPGGFRSPDSTATARQSAGPGQAQAPTATPTPRPRPTSTPEPTPRPRGVTVADATYKGKTSHGNPVRLDTSSSGRAITNVSIGEEHGKDTILTTNCKEMNGKVYRIWAEDVAFAIDSDGRFSFKARSADDDVDNYVEVSGRFSGESVSGTLKWVIPSLRSCNSDSVSWSARV